LKNFVDKKPVEPGREDLSKEDLIKAAKKDYARFCAQGLRCNPNNPKVGSGSGTGARSKWSIPDELDAANEQPPLTLGRTSGAKP
jgi:hypothetical protein